MSLRKRINSSADAKQAAADTEQALVSALQESDSPVEVLHDEIVGEAADERSPLSETRQSSRNAVGAVLLAGLALLVLRRRRR
jgi:MYXO-CTERM domain-containing protein